ncbi:MAG: DNA repair protein RadC [Chitinophagales bacterium]|nr:DNA repair protein RadC [Chitinophagales bacterium]MDW8273128.1 DNA repair protein RadC [Chitinophagales bacterium]
MTDEAKTSLSIKDWATADRPREKLLAKGREALSNAELLAIIIGSGNPEETAVDVAKKLLHAADNSLVELGKKDINALKKIKGIGDAKAVSIAAALELGRRRQAETALEKPTVMDARTAYEILLPDLSDLPNEVFMALLLNRRGQLIKKTKISSGGVSGTVVDIRMILKEALEHLCTSMIIAHNHPSGNLQPSAEDLKITQRLKQACELLDIKLFDHIIVGSQSYFSFAEEGKI